MLKALVVLLVAANLGLWAWSQGWLAPMLPSPQAAQREPQRLAAQQSPELVTVLPPQAASAAVSAAMAASAASSAQPSADAASAAADAASGAAPGAAASAAAR